MRRSYHKPVSWPWRLIPHRPVPWHPGPDEAWYCWRCGRVVPREEVAAYGLGD